jgi:hypothetical protein
MDRQIQTTGPRLTKAKKNKRKILTYICARRRGEKQSEKKKD